MINCHITFKFGEHNIYKACIIQHNLYSLMYGYYSSIDTPAHPLKRDFYLVKNGNVI